jgi:hypothetical protein
VSYNSISARIFSSWRYSNSGNSFKNTWYLRSVIIYRRPLRPNLDVIFVRISAFLILIVFYSVNERWKYDFLSQLTNWKVLQNYYIFNIKDAPGIQILNLLAFFSHWFVNSFFELKFSESRRSISILNVFFVLFRDLNDKVRVDHRIFRIFKNLCLVDCFLVFKDPFPRSNNKCPQKTANSSDRMHWSRSW